MRYLKRANCISFLVKIKSAYKPSGPPARSLSRFLQHEMTRGISSRSLDGILVHCRVTPSIAFAGTYYLYTWVEKGTARVKCLAQEYKTMTLARARARNSRTGVGLTNYEATAVVKITCLCLKMALKDATFFTIPLKSLNN